MIISDLSSESEVENLVLVKTLTGREIHGLQGLVTFF